jgi:hypothetical protein
LEKKGRATVVSSQLADALPIAREVTDVRTAATVIESWVRSDVEAPLLERRTADDAELPDALVAVGRPAPRSTLQFFTTAETGVASDHTDWVGLQIGACLRAGPTCLGARVRVSTVTDGPGKWESAMDRQTVSALANLDLPLPLGPFTVSPGIGLGFGRTHTRQEGSADSKRTLSLRGESHVSLSLPVSDTLSVEALLSLELADALDVDTTSTALPDDPTLLARVGVGVRFR